MAGEVDFLRRRSCRKGSSFGSRAGEEEREGGRERERRRVARMRMREEERRGEERSEEEESMKRYVSEVASEEDYRPIAPARRGSARLSMRLSLPWWGGVWLARMPLVSSLFYCRLSSAVGRAAIDRSIASRLHLQGYTTSASAYCTSPPPEDGTATGTALLTIVPPPSSLSFLPIAFSSPRGERRLLGAIHKPHMGNTGSLACHFICA